MPAPPPGYSSHFSAMPSYSAMPHHSANSNSSAFSVNAQPHEDWTQVSDLAERRRIQNRIAQRNYRKKLKRRLEDLEKRAGSSSVSPEPATAESEARDAASAARKRQSAGSGARSQASSRGVSNSSSHDPFSGQRDDGGLSVQHFYEASPRAAAPASSTTAYKGISSLDYPDVQSWQYSQSGSSQFYSPYFTPASSASSSPQFQASGFAKSDAADELHQWYGYPTTTTTTAASLDAPQGQQPRATGGGQRPSHMEPSTSQQSWQSHSSHYQPSQTLWEGQNTSPPLATPPLVADDDAHPFFHHADLTATPPEWWAAEPLQPLERPLSPFTF